MPKNAILGLETATSRPTIAVGAGGSVFEAEVTGGRHLDALTLRVRELLESRGLGFESLGGIGVSIGPGNFTGVKIGTATAKTLALALGIPVVGVSTLEVLAAGAVGAESTLCPLIDARRGELFWAAFKPAPGAPERLRPDALSAPERLGAELADLPGPVLLVGEPAERVAAAGGPVRVLEAADPLPRASSLLALAAARLEQTGPQSAVELVPNYIRGAVDRRL